MANALKSDFPQLPGDDDPNHVAVYQMVYDQLDAMGINHPGIPADKITRANLVNHLQYEAGKLLKKELQDARYQDKSDGDAADLLNAPDFANGKPARANVILVGFPFAPNAFTADDVTSSK